MLPVTEWRESWDLRLWLSLLCLTWPLAPWIVISIPSPMEESGKLSTMLLVLLAFGLQPPNGKWLISTFSPRFFKSPFSPWNQKIFRKCSFICQIWQPWNFLASGFLASTNQLSLGYFGYFIKGAFFRASGAIFNDWGKWGSDIYPNRFW